MFEYRLSQNEPLSGSGMSETVFETESRQEGAFRIEGIATTSDVARTFGTYLKALLDRSGMEQSAFGLKVGQTRGQITNITKGRRRPPKGQAGKWADALGLHGQEREDFIDLAAATYLPPDERARWWTILDRLHSQEVAARQRAESTQRSDAPTDRS